MSHRHRLGAIWEGDGWTRFSVWAPDRKVVEVALQTGGDVRHLPLQASTDGYFTGRFQVGDDGFVGAPLEGAVLYELHLGTFTEEGTFAGLRRKLPYLRDLGVTVVELMPVNSFPGRFNWGYDGTHLFSPCAGSRSWTRRR